MGTTPSPDRNDAKSDDSTDTTPLLSHSELPVEETIKDSNLQLDITDCGQTKLDATLKGDEKHNVLVNKSEEFFVEDEVTTEADLIDMLKEGYNEKGVTPNDVYLPQREPNERKERKKQRSTCDKARCHLRGLIFLIVGTAFASLIFCSGMYSLWGSESFKGLHQAAKVINADAHRFVESILNGTAAPPAVQEIEKEVLNELDYELEVLELDTPVRNRRFIHPGSNTSTECSQIVVQHVFGWSYGKPYVGSYTPPHCEFTHVYFKVSTTSKGRQFDRLWHLFYNDLEIWRSSTAEPTQSGINFHHVKDMTLYSNLLREPGKLILELGNLVDEKYTGSFNVTITATYYSPRLSALGAPNLPSAIIPISKRLSHQNKPSHFRLPSDRAVTTISRVAGHRPEILIPRNIKHMVLSISASGNADEEFWYQNVPSNFTQTFPKTMPDLLGHSSFREIQVLANGRIIAFANPFPHIFTGGINPGLWRPVVAIGTYDVGEVDIDLTAMIPFLMGSLKGDSKAAPTELEIRVVSENDGPIGNDWILTGRLLIWTHDSDTHLHSATTHRTPIHQMSSRYRVGVGADNENKTLDITTESIHKTHITTTLHYSTPFSRLNFLPPPISHQYTTTLHTTFLNNNTLTASGLNQTTLQLSNSTTLNTSPFHSYSASTSYPLQVISNLSFDSGFAIDATVNQSLIRIPGLSPSHYLLYNLARAYPFPFPSRTIISTTGKATYFQPARGGASILEGEGSQFINARQERVHMEAVDKYDRSVRTAGGRIVEECESLQGLEWLDCTDHGGARVFDEKWLKGVKAAVEEWSGKVRHGAREEGVQWLLGKRKAGD